MMKQILTMMVLAVALTGSMDTAFSVSLNDLNDWGEYSALDTKQEADLREELTAQVSAGYDDITDTDADEIDELVTAMILDFYEGRQQ